MSSRLSHEELKILHVLEEAGEEYISTLVASVNIISANNFWVALWNLKNKGLIKLCEWEILDGKTIYSDVENLDAPLLVSDGSRLWWHGREDIIVILTAA